MGSLIGRERERRELQRCIESDRSELVIVYGRRRVGKTFLIEEYFEQKYDFRYVGAHGLKTRDQLRNFARVLSSYSKKRYEPFKDWLDAFFALEDYLDSIPNDHKKVVFIDEMPWMDSGRSNFVSALENFWNGWAMAQRNVVLIATGSATSWMKDNIVANKGGLHARITCNLHLSPFTLAETEKYLESRGIEWSRYYLTQAYMVLGGIPFYYSLIDPTLSLAENIDALFFNEGALLKAEFDELYTALFTNADTYMEVVKTLSEHRYGLTRKEILKALKNKKARLSKILKNLELNDIVEQWHQFGNEKRKAVFRLTDFYTLFYYKFVDGNLSKNENWWKGNLATCAVSTWQGITFELVCLRHHRQIKKALGINGMSTKISTFHVKPNDEIEKGTQIDMVIDRADDMIHLCEMKYFDSEYVLDKEEERRLRERVAAFRAATKTKKTPVHTFVTTFGVANGKYKNSIHSELTMEDLFDF